MMAAEGELGRAALSVRQACAILGVGRATLYDLIASGRLPAFRPGKRAYRIPGEALTAFQEAEIRKVHAAHQRSGSEETR